MDMQQVLELLLANQKKAEASQERMEAKMDASQAEMNAKMDNNQAEMRSTVCTFWSELKETIQCKIQAVIQPNRSELNETTACNEVTKKTEPDPGMMQSAEEHQKIPNEDAIVKPVKEWRKRCRVQNLAAESLQKKKERTRRIRGSWKELAVARRKVTHPARVAWCKRVNIRKNWTKAKIE
jgi:hypothetical protein